jgi:alpha-methylacyl-CoA racemase
MEPTFYALLRDKCELSDTAFDGQWDIARWPKLKAKLAAVFAQKSRAQWCELLEGSDVCFAPVLNLAEAPSHAHQLARGAFANVDGVLQPASAPKMSATPAPPVAGVGEIGAQTIAILAELGLTDLPG